MDLSKLALLKGLGRKMAWLAQRQTVIAQNVANADTPSYAPRDLAPFSAKLRETGGLMDVRATAAGHLGRAERTGKEAKEDRSPYEVALDGNAVVLEEQMIKASETAVDHQMMTGLYQKHLAMIRMSLGRS